MPDPRLTDTSDDLTSHTPSLVEAALPAPNITTIAKHFVKFHLVPVKHLSQSSTDVAGILPSMSYDRRNQRTTTTTRRNGRYIPPPPPPPSGSHRNHSVLGYWVPLITIGTIAVGGLAAWVWSERGSDDDYPEDKPSRPTPGPGGPYPGPGGPFPGPGAPQYPNSGPQPPPGSFPSQDGPQSTMPPPVGGEASSYYGQASRSATTTTTQRNDNTFLSRVTGVIGRTPSPQQFFDQASRHVAAAGAAAGAALSSIMEENKHDDNEFVGRQGRSELLARREEREGFSDHERWSEEAEEKRRTEVGSSRRDDKGKARSKRIVAIVLSAETDDYKHDADASYHTEHGVC